MIFLQFPWYTEQQSLLLHLIVAALQLALILCHQFSNQSTGLQQEHFHSLVNACICGNSTVRRSIIFEHLHYVCHSMRCNSWVCFCLYPRTSKFAGYFKIRKYCFEQNRNAVRTLVTPVIFTVQNENKPSAAIQHHLLCFPVKLLLSLNSFHLQHHSYAFRMPCGVKDQEHPCSPATCKFLVYWASIWLPTCRNHFGIQILAF
jgi:hypothetical protein